MPSYERNYFIAMAALLLGLVAADVALTVKVTGDYRCLFVKCVVVK